MATATLTFNLEDPDDRMAHLRAVNSLEMALFIWELRHNILRLAVKKGLESNEMIDFISEKIDSLPFDIDELIV